MGIRDIRLEPARTGIGDPGNRSTWLELYVRDELTSGNPGTAASRNLPVYMDKYKEIRGKRGVDIYNPRTPAEKKNIIRAINDAREKIGRLCRAHRRGSRRWRRSLPTTGSTSSYACA